MAAKKIMFDWSETGLAVYSIVRREADGYLLDDADGSFKLAPADLYLSLAEDSTIKGRYEVSESRTPWNDGKYTAAVYKQAGGSPAPASDTIIGTGEMWVKDDAEVAVDDYDKFKADISTLAKQAKLDDLHDEAFGKWTLDPIAKTLTLYRASGAVLKVFDLTETTGTVPAFTQRTPR